MGLRIAHFRILLKYFFSRAEIHLGRGALETEYYTPTPPRAPPTYQLPKSFLESRPPTSYGALWPAVESIRRRAGTVEIKL